MLDEFKSESTVSFFLVPGQQVVNAYNGNDSLDDYIRIGGNTFRD